NLMSAILARQMNRRTFRRALLLPCQVVRERDFRLVADQLLDVSTGGLLARTRLPVLTGEDVIVSFRGPRTNTWIDAEATVARVVHGRRPGARGRCIGVEFHSLSEELTRRLFHELRGLSAPWPTRPYDIGVLPS